MMDTDTQHTIWQQEPIQVQYGDVWQLGTHRLMCGDSTKINDVVRLFAGDTFALCFTSPPYSNQRTYKIGSFNWHDLMCGTFEQIVQHGTPDCHVLINLGLSHKNRQVDMYWLQWLMQCAFLGWPVFRWYVWDKCAGMPHENQGALMDSHEFIFHFNRLRNQANKWIETKGKSGTVPGFREKDGKPAKREGHTNWNQSHKVPDSVIRIYRDFSNRTNHPAVFPVALPEFIYKTWSQPHDIVYEPFCGSGTSIIAGENLQRRVYAIDIEPTYCDLTIQRWQSLTGQRAHRISIQQEDAA